MICMTVTWYDIIKEKEKLVVKPYKLRSSLLQLFPFQNIIFSVKNFACQISF